MSDKPTLLRLHDCQSNFQLKPIMHPDGQTITLVYTGPKSGSEREQTTHEMLLCHLEQENQKLREALEHYADKEEWSAASDSSVWDLLFNSRDVDGDGWEVARRALKDD